MSIILLPVEILASIASEVQPQDLKNFVLTCRVVYSASQEALKEYRDLRKQYRHVGNAKPWQASPVLYHLPELLHIVLESPKIASHVEHFHYIDDDNHSYRAAGFRQSFQDRLEVLKLSNPERQSWWSDTRQNQYRPRANKLMVGLLLHHMPNLEAFQWHSVSFATELTDLLQPLQLHAGLRTPLLPALKKVWLSAGECVREYGLCEGQITLKQVIPFLALPTIEYMNLQDLRYADPPDDVDAAAVPPRSCNLQEFIIEHSYLSEALDHLLQLPRSLRKLDYVPEWPNSYDVNYELFPLSRAKQYDLEELTVHINDWRDHIDREALPLHTKLIFLETNCFLTDDATVTPASDIKHYFPPSLRHVVFTDDDREGPKDFLIYLQQILELRKAKILPDLRHLTLRSEAFRISSWNRKIKAVRRKCKALGVAFVIDLLGDEWGGPSRCPGRVSWWRRSHEGYSSADTDRLYNKKPKAENAETN